MKRRLALTAGALLAAVAFSSCSSVKTDRVVATVNGHQLTESQLDRLLDQPASDTTITGTETTAVAATATADEVRAAVSMWVQTVAASDDATGLDSLDALQARLTDLQTNLGQPGFDRGRAEYEKGVAGSPALCMRAIVLDATVDPQTVLDELAAGTPFADEVEKYSIIEALKATGGILGDGQGNDCRLVSSEDPTLLAALVKADVTFDEPKVVDIGGDKAIFVLRAFEELPTSIQQSFADYGTSVVLKERIDNAKISIDPRFGRWDSETGKVVGLGTG